MGGSFSNYNVGAEGVNLVKDPLELSDSEATQLQNAELVPDESKGGQGALSKRSGLAALNGSALAGSVLGMISLPLQTTFTRSLVAFLGDAAANTLSTSTDGTTWTATSTPGRAMLQTGRSLDGSAHKGPARSASIRSMILYAGNDYTDGSTNPPILFWDGTTAGELTRVTAAPTGDGTPPKMIKDWIVANGKVYFSVNDPRPGTAYAGAVYELNMDSGVVKMIGTAFGDAPGQTGGLPRCMIWYQGKLWVGLHAVGSAGAALGRMVSIDPAAESTWTVEGAVFTGFPISIAEFLGELYIGTEEQESILRSGVIKRTSSTGLYASVYSGGSDGDAHLSCLTVFDSALYAVEFHASATDILHVKKTTDGSTWTTDLDMDASVTGSVLTSIPLYPGDALVFDSKLYIAFKSTMSSATDGFVMQRTIGAVWTKVLSGNIQGTLGTLVART